MKYFIRSPYWTRHYKAETWWMPDSNGYTCLIAEAGVYTEDNKLEMEKYHETDRCEFVPITQALLEKAMKQLDRRDKLLVSDRIRLYERYKKQENEIQESIANNSLKYQRLHTLAEELFPR